MQASGELFGSLGEPQPGHSRRSGMEMICDVLRVVSEGSLRPTHILYKANMSWKVLSSCLDLLVQKGMVDEQRDGKRTTYSLTDRGRSILQMYDILRSVLAGRMNQSAVAGPSLPSVMLTPVQQKAASRLTGVKVHYSF